MGGKQPSQAKVTHSITFDSFKKKKKKKRFLFGKYLNVSSAATSHRAALWQTWSQTSAETLTQTAADPGATPPILTPAGNTAMFRLALVLSGSYWLFGGIWTIRRIVRL